MFFFWSKKETCFHYLFACNRLWWYIVHVCPCGVITYAEQCVPWGVVTNSNAFINHCTLYTRVGWPSLALQRLSHWYVVIYKAILRQLPFYLCIYIVQQTNDNYQFKWVLWCLIDDLLYIPPWRRFSMIKRVRDATASTQALSHMGTADT
jgi:hypothetical protein